MVHRRAHLHGCWPTYRHPCVCSPGMLVRVLFCSGYGLLIFLQHKEAACRGCLQGTLPARCDEYGIIFPACFLSPRLSNASFVSCAAAVGGEKTAGAQPRAASQSSKGSTQKLVRPSSDRSKGSGSGHEELTSGTIKEKSTIGVDAVAVELSRRARVPIRRASAPLYFAFDHCFSVRGQGTILTGTVLTGEVKVSTTVVTLYFRTIYPPWDWSIVDNPTLRELHLTNYRALVGIVDQFHYRCRLTSWWSCQHFVCRRRSNPCRCFGSRFPSPGMHAVRRCSWSLVAVAEFDSIIYLLCRLFLIAAWWSWPICSVTPTSFDQGW